MKVLNNRYLFEDKVSTDSTGEIYRVKDLAMDGRVVHLKLYSVEFSSERTVDSLVEDLEKLKSVKHPNLTEIFDFDIVTHVDGKHVNYVQYCYTFEYLNEALQVDYLLLSRDEMRSAIVQILNCLKYLHYRGVTYRYLNFQNMMFFREPEGLKVKLRNLIFMSFYNETYILNSGNSNVFMAPEVIWENTAYPTSDVYSFGVLLYYLYFGNDYKEKQFSELYVSHSENDVHGLIRKMTNTYVGDRQGSIDEVIEDLSTIMRLKFGTYDYASYNRIYRQTNLVGRHKDVMSMTELVRQRLKNKTGSNGALVIGEKGMGKTRFLSEIQFRLRLSGLSVMRLEAKPDQDFSLFKEVIRKIFSTDRVGFDLVQQYGGELVKLIPEIADRWKINPGEILQLEKENLKIANRVYNFVADFSDNEPMAILIDNLDQLNKYDLFVLDYLMRREAKTPMFIIAAGSELVLDNNCIQSWTNGHHVKKFILNGFTYEDASNFLGNVFGIVSKPLNFTTHLMKNIGGNPGRMVETIAELFHNGVLKVGSNHAWNFEDVVADNSIMETEDQVQEEWSGDPLSPLLVSILEVISIFEEAVSCETLSAFMDLDHKSTHDLLNELIGLAIVEEKFNDYGYTYNFINRKFKDQMVAHIAKEQLIEYHKKAAEIFEEEIKSNKKKYSEALIHHLFLSKQYEKAAQYCIFAAEQMRSFNIDSQVLSFYDKAMKIFVEMKQLNRVSEILCIIGNVYQKNGRYEEAMQVHLEGHRLALECADQRSIIDHATSIVSMNINASKLDECEKLLEDIKMQAQEHEYIQGELEAEVQLIRIHILRLEYDRVAIAADEVLNKAQRVQNDEYMAKAHYYAGCYQLYKCLPYEALHELELAYSIQKKHDFGSDLLDTLYAMGSVHVDLLGMHEKGRDLFKQGQQYADAINQVDGKDLSYIMIAQSYLIQDRYHEATVHLMKALELSESIGKRSSIFPCYVLLCRVYIATNEYDKAFAMMKKAELDFRKNRYWSNYSIQYYYACIEFYLETKNLDKAEYFIHELMNSELYERAVDRTELEVFRFVLENYKDNYLLYNKTIDYDFVEKRIANLSGLMEGKYLRQAILCLAGSFIQHQKYIDVQKLLYLDEKLQSVFSTEALSVRRAVVEGVLTNDRISYYNKLLYKYEQSLKAEDYWLVNKILGDEYDYNGNLYLSINSYFSAFDTVRNLTNKLNHTLRDNYIIFDEAKIDLKKKINGMMLRVLEGKVDAERLHFKGIEYNSLDEYFEVGPVHYLYADKKFMESVYEHYASRYRRRYESINDLAIDLGSDDRGNIHNILDYFIQRLVAERGYLFILDESGKVADVLKSDVNSKVPDITPFIKNAESAGVGLVVSSLYDTGNRHLLSKNQKAAIMMPVRRPSEQKPTEIRRKAGEVTDKTPILGYLYMESNMVFNNFTEENVEALQSAINLLNVLLDNYNLKRVSTNDRLTGVYLRKYIEEVFPVEMNRARVQNLKFSVIMADIDKFKNINDSYGHRKGDEILSQIGRTLKNTLRKNDYVGRYGGEEFVILLPETGFNDAYLICEKLRKNVEELVMLGDNKPVTLSFGVAEYPTHGLNEEELMERADQSLYFSKKTGRNRTTVWNESIGQEYLRFDRLAGILTGNISSDTRTVQAIMDIVDLFKGEMSQDEKILRVMNTLIDITEAQDCAIFVPAEEGAFRALYAKEKGREGWVNEFTFDPLLLESYMDKETGNYLINWEDTSNVDEVTGIPIWRSCMLIPLVTDQTATHVSKALLTLSVPISKKEFDFNTFNFTNSLSGIVASML